VHWFDNWLRPLLHRPKKLFGPYVQPGMTVMDVGCGRGFASLGLARLVGRDGVVIAADLQPEMLDMVRARAAAAGLVDRIRTRRCQIDRIGVEGPLDFAVAFWMVHEVPDASGFLIEVHDALKGGGRLFLAEPRLHVSGGAFDDTVRLAESAGFRLEGRPRVLFSRSAVLSKPS
jgi:ubiquinone/menaquinone biosynthesis C-methylase UbiE